MFATTVRIIKFFLPPDEFSPPTRDLQKIVSKEMVSVKTLLGLHLLHRGLATMGSRFFVLSAVHTKQDIDQTIEAFGSALEDMVAEGKVPKAD